MSDSILRKEMIVSLEEFNLVKGQIEESGFFVSFSHSFKELKLTFINASSGVTDRNYCL